MVTSSGRCHGPRCQQAALVAGGFCSESCQARWNIRAEGRPEPHPTQADLDATLRALHPQLEAHLAAVIQAADPPPPAPTFTVAEVARIASSLPRTTPEPAKLTREQFDALTRAFPDRPGWCPNGELGRWDGVPIEFVETVEESTPYLLAQRARFKPFYLNEPVVAQSVTEPSDGLVLRYSDGTPATSAGTTFPLVASEDPQVADDHPWANPRLIGAVGQPGWLERLFDRLFRRSSRQQDDDEGGRT